MDNLSKRQEEVLGFIWSYLSAGERPPSYQDIADFFSWSNRVTVLEHLKALERKGVIRRNRKARSIQILAPQVVAGEVHQGPFEGWE